MSPSLIEFLNHIKKETEFLLRNSQNISYDEFISGEFTSRAFLRSLEIIGEAVKKIPQEIRTQYPLIEWKEVTGLRDKLIHHYFGVDYELVWDTIKNDIPKLDEALVILLKNLK